MKTNQSHRQSPPNLVAAFFCCLVLFCSSHSNATAKEAAAATSSRAGETLGDLLEDFHRGIDRPELYNHYYEHLVRVKFSDAYRVRLRDGNPVDVDLAVEESARPQTLAKTLTKADSRGASAVTSEFAFAGQGVDSGLEGLFHRDAEAGNALTNPEMISALAELNRLGVNWEAAFGLREEDLDRSVARAEEKSGKPMPDLNNYFLLRLPGTVKATTVVRLMRSIPVIEEAYFTSKPVAPPAATASADCVPDYADPDRDVADGGQLYLGSAPVGIDARFAWEGFRGNGDGIKICDVEYDMAFNHADLPNVLPLAPLGPPPSDLNAADIRSHGTAVMGIMAGVANGFGVTGIAHGATFRFVSQTRVLGENDPPFAISLAFGGLNDGDVMVCEMQEAGPNRPSNPAATDQSGLVAVSFDRVAYDIIKVAVANDVIVCEAAGNGRENLDDFVYTNNNSDRVPGWPNGEGPFLDRSDTGSIIVGAAEPYDTTAGAVGLAPTSDGNFTNIGSTLDLQGWGKFTIAPGYGNYLDLDGINYDYTIFSGTSCATPMMAGACALLQTAFKLKNGRVGDPDEILQILRSTGTPQEGVGNIGPRPDLRAAIESLADAGIPNPPAPIVVPPAGTYAGNVLVQMNYPVATMSLQNARIHYTLDGTDPTLEDYQYIPETASGVYVGNTLTVKARTWRRDNDMQRWFPGPVVDVLYTIPDALQVATPRFLKINNTSGLPTGDLLDGFYPAPLKFIIQGVPASATTKYRKDGNRFNLFWFNAGTIYTPNTVIELGVGDHDLVARAFQSGMDPSEMTETINVQVVEMGTANASGIYPLPEVQIQPPGGTYANSPEITLTLPIREVEIRYTTDGSDPDQTSLLYTNQPILLDGSGTVKARAYLAGYLPSPVASEDYTIVQIGILQPPNISPNGGNFTSNVQLIMTSSTPDAEIRYTTNGSEPNEFSTLYDGVFSLGIGFHEVKAKTFLGHIPPSATRTSNINVYSPSAVVQTPVVTPNGGSHTLLIEIEMSCATEGATIHYTIDQLREVTQNDPVYVPPRFLGANPPPNANPTRIYRVRAFEPGLVPSQQVQIAYNMFWPVGGDVADIAIEPNGGVYDNPVSVQFTTPTSSATFYYTTDGTAPADSSTSIRRNNSNGANQVSESVPFNHSKSGTLRVAGTRLGFNNSAIAEADFQFICGTPEITPNGGTHTDMVEVAMSSSTQNSQIRYTLDGSEPDTSSTLFSGGPLMLGEGTHSLQARAFRNNFEPSAIATAVFSVDPTPSVPVITSQPQSLTADTGDNITLEIIAAGIPGPAYAWTFNGIPLAFAGSALTLNNVSSDDAGDYQVTVANLAGSVTSEVATVIVNHTLSPLEQWRQEHFGTTANEGDAADDADPDGDGDTNIKEFNAGTIPTDAGSVFAVSRVSLAAPNLLRLTVATVSGKNYCVARSSTLFGWSLITGSEFAGDGTVKTIDVDIGNPGATVDYFRVETLP